MTTTFETFQLIVHTVLNDDDALTVHGALKAATAKKIAGETGRSVEMIQRLNIDLHKDRNQPLRNLLGVHLNDDGDLEPNPTPNEESTSDDEDNQ